MSEAKKRNAELWIDDSSSSSSSETSKNTAEANGATNSEDSNKKARVARGGSSSAVLEVETVPKIDFTPHVAKKQNASSKQASEIAKNSPSSEAEEVDDASVEEVVTKYTTLPSAETLSSSKSRRVTKLTNAQLEELELVLQLDQEGGWREDWMGNLALLTKDVPNPINSSRTAGAATLPFWEWSTASTVGISCLALVRCLFIHVYYMEKTPDMAKQILAQAITTSSNLMAATKSTNLKKGVLDMITLVQSLFYHPLVLQQDGWTTKPALESTEYASGGPTHIGKHIVWQKYEAVVIAFVNDADIGDLWKCLWLEDLETFDLEAGELFQAEKRYQRTNRTSTTTTKSSRFANASNYTVDGIEHGIVLAATYHPSARPGVMWPARIMHVSEHQSSSQARQRSSSKNKVQVIFLAPYWNGRDAVPGRRGGILESYGDNPSAVKSIYSSGPLLELDTVEVSKECIQKYPHGGDELNLDQLRVAFKFTGLPKAAYGRFLDSHRLAMALKTYARQELAEAKTRRTNQDTQAMATLTDTHALAIMVPVFPSALLHLPFDYVLSSLPSHQEQEQNASDDFAETLEPVLQLNSMLEAMKPPHCWGQESNGDAEATLSLQNVAHSPGVNNLASPARPMLSNGHAHGRNEVDDSVWALDNFVSKYLMTLIASTEDEYSSPLSRLGRDLNFVLTSLQKDLSSQLESGRRQGRLRDLIYLCFMTKSHGEDLICTHCQSTASTDGNSHKMLTEWRKACERIYRRAVSEFSNAGFGNGVTLIVTDSRCSQHITPSGCVERPVRLPAALKGAKMAGAGASPSVQFVMNVNDRYIDLAEQSVLEKAHKLHYLKRMKSRCVGLAPDAKGVPLTDDSDGRGGEDTMGSRGTYTAAVSGVAAALQSVDDIVGGKCVNAFCATRPPGHHAGRDLHAMKAVSNGFCVLNPAACAALYATTPQSQGGPGLQRVCVIDFDVHHGNGTQDILCSTYDPRFFYVSLHAGGAHINGYEPEDESLGGGGPFTPGSSTPQKNGIFPGRCGDTNPHKGVLNIPLGARVTPHDVGSAIVTVVTPAVDAFAPDLIILSAGFDAHKNDPLGMGGLSARDFGSITEVACSMAKRSCSGRVLSILEGGYGVPCCRPQTDLFLPKTSATTENGDSADAQAIPQAAATQAQPRLFDLDDELPEHMDDQLPPGLRRKLDKCHAEGFVDCVCEHVRSLAKGNDNIGKP